MNDQAFEIALKRRGRSDLVHPDEQHPDSDTIIAYSEGTLTKEASAHIDVHLAFCKQCFQDLAILRRAVADKLQAVQTTPKTALRGKVRSWVVRTATVLLPLRTPELDLAGADLRGKPRKSSALEPPALPDIRSRFASPIVLPFSVSSCRFA